MAVLVSTMDQPPTTSAQFRYEVLPPVYNAGKPPPTPVSHPPYHPTPTTTPAPRPQPAPYIPPATQTTHLPLPTTRPVHPPSPASLPSFTLPSITRRPWSSYRPSSPQRDKNALKPKATSAHKPAAPPVLGDVGLAYNEVWNDDWSKRIP